MLNKTCKTSRLKIATKTFIKGKKGLLSRNVKTTEKYFRMKVLVRVLKKIIIKVAGNIKVHAKNSSSFNKGNIRKPFFGKISFKKYILSEKVAQCRKTKKRPFRFVKHLFRSENFKKN